MKFKTVKKGYNMVNNSDNNIIPSKKIITDRMKKCKNDKNVLVN